MILVTNTKFRLITFFKTVLLMSMLLVASCQSGDDTNQPPPETGTEDTTPPSIPAGVTAAAISTTQIEIQWSASMDDNAVSGYRIYRNGNFITTVDSSRLSYIDNALSPGTMYTYTVTAADSAGNQSGHSLQAAATTASENLSSTLMNLNFNAAPSAVTDGGIFTGDIGSARLWLTQGSFLTYLATGGWSNTGGAMFTPLDGSQAYQGYAGLAPINLANAGAQINLRFLIKWSAGFASQCESDGTKWTILHRAGGTDNDRTWMGLTKPSVEVGGGLQIVLNYQNTLYGMHGGNADCNTGFCTYGNVCAHCSSSWERAPNSNPFRIDDFEDQWVAVEFESKNNGELKIYIWTQDGTYNGDYLWTTSGPAMDIATFDVIGGFWNSPCSNGANFIFDEMRIDTSFIGPPDGF